MLSVLLASIVATSGPVPPSVPEPPLNVLWLSVEDMSPWIGSYGDSTVPTPHLDAFAAGALRFDNAFADSPVCAPARTALITGMYPTRIGAMHMRVRSRSRAAGDAAYGDLPLYEAVPPLFVRCFPEHLRRAGYYATNNAKTDYQFAAPAWTWDDSSREAHYRRRPAGAPFFAVFNHGGTHESQAFPDARRRPSKVAAEDVPIPPIYPDTPAVRDALKRTYDNIAAMDEWVGQRLAELEESGQSASTVVFFFSDHGVGLPRGKRSVYGTGTRVPLLVRFPDGRWPAGLAGGTATDRIVSFVDFGPTVLGLCGIEPDPRLDGRAFLGEHAGPRREFAYFHADRFDAVRDRTRAATDGRRLVVHNLLPDVPHLIANAYRERLPMTHDLYELRDGGARAWAREPGQWQTGSSRRPAVEWYDRADDPWEVRNLSGSELDETARGRFVALERALAAWIDDTGDLGLVEPEAEMVRTHLWPPDGVQPTTATPTLVQAGAGGRDGGTEVQVACATDGASIGVRFDGEGPWRPAGAERFEVPPGVERVEVRAHRLGHAPSGTLGVDL